LPEGHITTDLRGRVARAEKRARMSFYYSRIYGTYTNMKSTFSSARTHDLYESLPEEDRHEFPFDIAEVDWKAWLQETHLPALTRKPGRKRRRKVSEAAGEIAAIFDVDGTLVASNVVSHYAWLKLRDLPAILRPLWAAILIGRVPFYWALDKVSRAHFNRAFYKNYKGWKPARARVLGKESFSSYLLKRLYPEAVATLRAHKAQGHRVVLLSALWTLSWNPSTTWPMTCSQRAWRRRTARTRASSRGRRWRGKHAPGCSPPSRGGGV
jgi:hypothetical protein